MVGAPRVYVDANVPAGTVALMRQVLVWDVLFVLEHPDLRRATDADHFTRARDLGRTLITLDHDFLDDKRFPVSLSPGVIVCSAPDERRLAGLLRRVDREIFRAEPSVELPLLGRKLVVTPDVSDSA